MVQHITLNYLTILLYYIFIIYLFINFIIIIIKNKIRYTTEYLHNKKLFNLKIDEQRIDSLEK